MIALLIILCVLIIILFTPVSLFITLDGEFNFCVRYLFIKFSPGKPRKIKKSANEPAETTDDKNKEPGKSGYFKKLFKEKGFSAAFNELCAYALTVLRQIRFILKHIQIRLFHLDLKIAASDASATALAYGGACSAVYPVLAFLNSNIAFSMKNVNISADFHNKKSSVVFKAKASIRPFFVICAAASLLYGILKIKKQGEQKQ